MPSKKEHAQASAEEVLVPYNVVIDGQDRTIFAKDQKDLEARIAAFRRPVVSTPLTDEQ